jgi:hypothetical protein
LEVPLRAVETPPRQSVKNKGARMPKAPRTAAEQKFV